MQISTFKGIYSQSQCDLHLFRSKKIGFFPIFGMISPIFVFWTDFLKIFSLSRPLLPLKTLVSPRSPPLSFYIGNRENFEKIGFPMPATESEFQILNQHTKIHRKKNFFIWTFVQSLPELQYITKLLILLNSKYTSYKILQRK